MLSRARSPDLGTLLDAADPHAPLAARNLWLVQLIQWLREPEPPEPSPPDARADDPWSPTTPAPIRRLTRLLDLLEADPVRASAFAAVVAGIWSEHDTVSLFAEVGFAPRMALWGEFVARLQARVLPAGTDTRELGALFELLFPDEADATWIDAVDQGLLGRLGVLFGAVPAGDWRQAARDAVTALVSAVAAVGLSGPLRQRMSPSRLQDRPFARLVSAWEQVEAAMVAGDPRALALAVTLQQLRGQLDRCRLALDSIPAHLEAHGVSVDLVFAVEQAVCRLERVEALLACLLTPRPERELQRLLGELVRMLHARRSLRTLFARHYALLARKVAERNAETGERYITRDRAEYRDMLARAAGGGAVIAATTFGKFALAALGLSAFWGGVGAGGLYAASFVLIFLLHWTVATKLPAMTAPALAARLRQAEGPAGIEAFVDEVGHLVRSQAAGVLGNVAMCVPLVLAVQWAGQAWHGAPPVDAHEAAHVLDSLNVLGAAPLYAAFTGVLLFASSLVAGWVENGFVLHRIDRAIAWNPRIVRRLGAARAARWSAWWRANVSGLAANVSLGLMLGLVPVLLQFVGLPIEVRHVTLSSGQLAAASAALGWPVLAEPAFWLCVAGVALTGLLNVGVSFALAFRLALRARGIRLDERRQLRAAILARLRRAPASFLLPPRRPAQAEARLPLGRVS